MTRELEPENTRVVLAGGGTGGHIYLGMAIIEALRKRRPLSVLFVGTQRGMEQKVLQGENMKLEYIDVRGLKGMGLRGLLRAGWDIPRSLRQSARILREFQPDLAIGLGGYSAGPVLWKASQLGVATLIVEPNVLPGITNRWLKRRVNAAVVAFEETRRYLGTRCHVTGVPVRQEFFSSAAMERDPRRFRLLIFGGSQGSRRINQWMTQALPFLQSGWRAGATLEIVHQTGESDFEWVAEVYRKAGFDADVRPFIHNMPEEVGRADLLVTRSGAGTIGELCAAGRASLMIPFAQSSDQHQLRNAQAMVGRGAGFLLEEKDVTAKRLADRVLELAAQPQWLALAEAAARGLAQPDAADRICDIACGLLERRAA